MSNHSNVYLITTLAEYQTDFWVEIGEELRRRHQAVAFISFDDRSTEMLHSRGFESFHREPSDAPMDISDAAVDSMLRHFDMDNLNFWFSHERFTFGIGEDDLRTKLLTYLSLADRACRTLRNAGQQVVMVQELGGFISVIASFFAARHHGIDNWFIEPAFFRGRMFFLRNDFSALKISTPAENTRVSSEVNDYLDATLASGAIVVPKKDRHQYTTAFRKIVNRKNLKRLVVKLVDKHLHGKRQEFGYIGRHVRTHARMLRNSLRLRGHYTPLSDLDRFIYYPLHVPGDMALTLRSPQYLDQLALIDYLARSIPHGYHIAIKEHPAMIGAVDAQRLIELTERYDNLVLLPPSTNNYEVLRAAELIVSVNSKSGAEAALLGKPVLVLGDAFYRDADLVRSLNNVTDLPAAIRDMVEQPPPSPERAHIGRYFEAIWRASVPGELYITDADSVRQFTDSMLEALGSR